MIQKPVYLVASADFWQKPVFLRQSSYKKSELALLNITANCWGRERLADRKRIEKLLEMLFRPWHKPERLRKRLRYKSRDRLKF